MQGLMKLLAAAVLCLPAAIAWGQERPRSAEPPDLTELSIEELMEIELVYGPSRYAQRASEAPSSVTVVTAAEIRQFGYRTLGDVLDGMRGFYVSSDRNYSYVGVRGFGRPGDYNSRVLVLIDGHRINDNVYSSALIENSFVLDVDLIERVEVVRGPISSIYGTSAFFPVVVNIITRSAGELRNEVALEVGSFGTTQGRASYAGRSTGGLDLVASGTYAESRGQRLYFPEFDTPATNDGIAERADDERYYRGFLHAALKRVAIEAAFVSREKGIPTGSFGTVFNDPRTRTWDETGFVSLKANQTIGKGFTLFGQLSYDRYRYRGEYIYDNPPVTVNRDEATGEWISLDGLAVYTGLAGHTLIVGSELQENLRQEQGNFDVDPYQSYLHLRTDSDRWAMYAQDEIRVTRALIVNVGIRHDEQEHSGSKLSPRLALIVSPTPRSSLKLLAGQGHRWPNQYEMFYETETPAHKPNPGLDPETIRTYELVFDQGLHRNLRFTACGFYSRIDGLITFTADPSDGATQFHNAGEVESRGFELEASGKHRGIGGRVSYSFQSTRDRSSGELLTNSPRHMGRLHLTVPLAGEKLTGGLAVRYTGVRRTLAGDQVGGFAVADLSLVVVLVVRDLELSGSVYKLFDRRYWSPASEEHVQDVIWQDGRSFRARLTWRP